MTTAIRKRLCVNDVTTVKFGDREVEAVVVNIRNGWILARVDEPTKQGLPYGYIMTRE